MSLKVGFVIWKKKQLNFSPRVGRFAEVEIKNLSIAHFCCWIYFSKLFPYSSPPLIVHVIRETLTSKLNVEETLRNKDGRCSLKMDFKKKDVFLSAAVKKGKLSSISLPMCKKLILNYISIHPSVYVCFSPFLHSLSSSFSTIKLSPE